MIPEFCPSKTTSLLSLREHLETAPGALPSTKIRNKPGSEISTATKAHETG
jgi:hypothetical protein